MQKQLRVVSFLLAAGLLLHGAAHAEDYPPPPSEEPSEAPPADGPAGAPGQDPGRNPEVAPPPPAPHWRGRYRRRPYQQPIPRHRPYGPYRRGDSSWYIGFGAGGGTGWIDPAAGSASSKEGGVALSFKVGAVLSPSMLLGLDISAWRYQGSAGRSLQFNHYDIALTGYLVPRLGLYLKGGAGVGFAILEFSDGSSASTQEGLDLKGAIGWELPIFRNLFVGLELAQASIYYDDGWLHDLTVQLALTWY